VETHRILDAHEAGGRAEQRDGGENEIEEHDKPFRCGDDRSGAPVRRRRL
jgi:hypothetical protein